MTSHQHLYTCEEGRVWDTGLSSQRPQLSYGPLEGHQICLRPSAVVDSTLLLTVHVWR